MDKIWKVYESENITKLSLNFGFDDHSHPYHILFVYAGQLEKDTAGEFLGTVWNVPKEYLNLFIHLSGYENMKYPVIDIEINDDKNPFKCKILLRTHSLKEYLRFESVDKTSFINCLEQAINSKLMQNILLHLRNLKRIALNLKEGKSEYAKVEKQMFDLKKDGKRNTPEYEKLIKRRAELEKSKK